MGRSESWCVKCSVEVQTNMAVHELSTVHLMNLSENKTCVESVEQISQKRTPPFAIPTSNKGYKLLQSMGWKSGEGLGIDKQGRKEPVATCLKKDRAGLGKKKLKPRITHIVVQHKTVEKEDKKITKAMKKQIACNNKRTKAKKDIKLVRELFSDIPEEYQGYL